MKSRSNVSFPMASEGERNGGTKERERREARGRGRRKRYKVKLLFWVLKSFYSNPLFGNENKRKDLLV